LGGASSALSLWENLMQDEVDSGRVMLDVLGLASLFLTAGGRSLETIGQKGIAFASRSSRYFYIGAVIAEVGEGVLITQDGLKEINSILEDKTLDQQEQLLRLTQVILQLVVTLGMIAYSAKDHENLQSSLRKKGLSEAEIEKLAKNPEDLILADTLSAEEITQAKREKRSLTEFAEEKHANKERLEYEQALKRHYSTIIFNYNTKDLVEVRKGVYDIKNRKHTSSAKEIEYEDELDFAEELVERNSREMIIAPEDFPAIDGIYKDNGQPFQLKNIESAKMVYEINSVYNAAQRSSHTNVDLQIKLNDGSTKKRVETLFKVGIVKQQTVIFKDDDTISQISVSCIDGIIKLIK
jgi:hypothetical protein